MFKKTFFSGTRSRLLAFFLLIIICSIIMGAVNDAAMKEITITEVNAFENAENSLVVKTRQQTVGQLLSENNITIGEYDNVNLLSDEELSDHAKLVIRRGKPFTVVTAEGEYAVSTTKATVGEALLEIGIYIDDIDDVNPPRETKIIEGMRVVVAEISISEISVEEEIEYATKTEQTRDLYKGEKKTVQSGVVGKKTVVYRITEKDGVEIGREAICETVTKEPVTEIVKVGTKEKTINVYQESRNGNLSSRGEIRYKAVYTMKATAYDPSPASNGGASRTATGTTPRYGIVAVDPDVIPLGSRLYIESADDGQSWVYGYAIAGDTGGAIKGNRIDLCFGSKSEALSFGVKKANVYVLD
ncbi:MAG: 3D domain-containing protein [Clostridia bacterium]|nr:3D domain-containing protein [Clostridia bacterium]